MYLHRLHDQYIVIRDRVDVLEEGTQETNRKLGIVEFKVDELMKWTTAWHQRVERRLDGYDKRFVSIDERFDAVDKRFEAVDEKLAEHDKRFESIDEKLAEHDKRFDAMDRKMDQKFDELKALLVDALERKN